MTCHLPEVLTLISPDISTVHCEHTMVSISFGSNNLGNQVGANYGVIHLPPGGLYNTLLHVLCKLIGTVFSAGASEVAAALYGAF